MRFREDELSFKISDTFEEINQDKVGWYSYPQMVKKQGTFTLDIEPGKFKSSQITILLGENGTGKTTLIQMLVEAGKKKDENEEK